MHNWFLSSPELDLLDWNRKSTPGAITLMAMRNPIVMFKIMFKRMFGNRDISETAWKHFKSDGKDN